LRRIIGPFAETQSNDRTPVCCYPHRWDSVNFYLRRDDVQVFVPDQRASMIAEFAKHARTLLFIKSEGHLPDLVRTLPANLEFVPCSTQFSVTVGWVRPRAYNR
jgi:hypothetical protein